MKKKGGPLPALVGGTIVVAGLATVLTHGGWVLWIPVLLALAVVGGIWHACNR